MKLRNLHGSLEHQRELPGSESAPAHLVRVGQVVGNAGLNVAENRSPSSPEVAFEDERMTEARGAHPRLILPGHGLLVWLHGRPAAGHEVLPRSSSEVAGLFVHFGLWWQTR